MKIPQNAKKVFNGKIFSVYQWEQEMFDGTKEIFEMLERPNTVQIIAAQGDKIFLAYEEQPAKEPSYTMFGGRVNSGEKAIDAAKRELKEESGLISNDWELINVIEPYNKISWKIYIFIARECKKICEPNLDPGEKIETKIVDFNEFIDIATSEKFWGRELTMEALRMKLDKNKMDKFKKKIFKT